MTEQEWLVSTDPKRMWEWCAVSYPATSKRKTRLLCVASCLYAWKEFKFSVLQDAILIGESYADGKKTETEIMGQ